MSDNIVVRSFDQDFPRRFQDALVASGLVDEVEDVAALDPRPVRYSEGDFVCRRGDKAHCLWVVVDGAVAVRDEQDTLFVCQRHDVVGEQNLLGNGCHRWYDLVVSQRQAELLVIDQHKIERHPQRDLLWRNISKILSLKLKATSSENAMLQSRIEDDTRILRAYTNEYALSRRLQSGRALSTDYKIDNAIVWFSDIENFSRHILNMSPSRTADIVQRFFNAQTQPIEERGGHIDKFMGDGLMAFWMLPTDVADVAICEAAVAAAEEAVAEVNGIVIGSEALDLRVGLHFGLVLSGDFGSATRHQFTLIGADVNKAARLEEIHPADVTSGSRELGPIRLSAEFRSNLPISLQQKYARHSVSDAKNIGQVEFYS